VIFLLAPTSTRSRQAEVIKRTKGFIYYVSLTGITGAKLVDLENVRQNVNTIRKATKKPIAVGFGISTAKDAKAIADFADGVVVGSAIVRQIAEHQQDSTLVERISQFTQGLKTAILNGK